jgi:hypothetical protein
MYLLAALQYEDPTIVHKPTSSTPVPRPRKAYVSECTSAVLTIAKVQNVP